MHTDALTCGANILAPTEGGSLLDRDTGDDIRWQNVFTVLPTLLLEELPAWHADHTGLDPIGCQFLVSLEAEGHLTAGGEEKNIWLPRVSVGENVGALGEAACRRI